MNIAIDIGGTKVSAALLDGLRIVERKNMDSHLHQDWQSLVPRVIELCRPWASQAEGIGIACTGIVKEQKEVFFSSVAGVKTLPVKRLFEQAFNKPVVLLNDAWAAAWSEYTLCEHQHDGNLVYITVSTGIGGGIVQNNRLLTSDTGFAAHLGHLTVGTEDGEKYACSCGRINCIESMASGQAISQQVSALCNEEVSCKKAFDMVFSNEAQADIIAPIIDRAAQAVAQLIANIKAVTGTRIVVLGGSVGLAEGFVARVQSAIDALPALYATKVVRSALGKDSDLLGAGLMIQSKLNDI